MRFLCQGGGSLYIRFRGGCCASEQDLATELTKEDLRQTYDMNIHPCTGEAGPLNTIMYRRVQETLFVILPSPGHIIAPSPRAIIVDASGYVSFF